MKRRSVLRRCGSALATATTLGLAGCTGEGNEGDGGGTDGDGTPTEEDDGQDEEPAETTVEPVTETTTPRGGETTTTSRDLGDPIGEVKESSVEGLRIVGLESKVAESHPYPRQGEWGVKIDLENSGDQSTELNEYTWALTVYDDAGDVLKKLNRKEGNMIVSPAGGRTLAAGETTGVAIQSTEAIDAEKVGRYEVSLTCGTFADGVYCE